MAPARHAFSPRRALATPLALVLAAGLLAGCGSSGHGSSTRRSGTSTPAGSAPGGGTPTGAAQIKHNWMTFFNGSTQTATRVALLQDGQRFSQVLSAQSKSQLAQQAAARVRSVVLTSARTAKVRYDVLVAGQPALPNQTGTAILSGGTWRVSDASFCNLLRLEGGAPAACPKG